jgi:hypothetical protein
LELEARAPAKSRCVAPHQIKRALSTTASGPSPSAYPDYPVAIVTHALFQSGGSENGTLVHRCGEKIPRALTLADEQMEDVNIFDVQLSAAEDLRERIQHEADHDITPRMDTLVKFMMSKAFAGRSLEKPVDDAQAWAFAAELDWFASAEAKQYAARHRERWPNIDKVFGFARCAASDYAFISRDNSGKAGVHFLGYEPKHSIVPGMVLLDATADIDGITQICPWRSHADVPHGRYDKLSIVFVPTCADESNLTKYLGTAGNRRTYADWIAQVIRQEMEPGQLGLIVCKKKLLDHKNIEGPYPINPAAEPDETAFGWNVDGRHLGVTYWGGPGLGSNAWKDAEVVFLFDEHHLPRRATIAQTQGHQLEPTSAGVLALMTDLKSKTDEVDWIKIGHILRWVRQMALRGKGRIFDEHGVCGEQKVVIAAGPGGLERFCLNKDQLFPGASVKIKGFTDAPWQLSQLEHLLVSLSDPTLPDDVSASRIGELMGMAWRSVSIDMKGDTEVMLKALGWKYESRPGRAGSLFRRLPRSARVP